MISDILCQGHDIVILEDIKSSSWRPPVLWIEWFRNYMLTCETPDAKIDKCVLEVRISNRNSRTDP